MHARHSHVNNVLGKTFVIEMRDLFADAEILRIDSRTQKRLHLLYNIAG